MLKKTGKFIKKNSHVLDLASVKDFSFENIASYPFVLFDNKSRSLIQPDLHTKESLDVIVNTENRCDIDLVNSESKRGLLWPVDFTQEIRQGEEYGRLLKNYELGGGVIESEVGMEDFSEGMEDLTKGVDFEAEDEDFTKLDSSSQDTKQETIDDNNVDTNNFSQNLTEENQVENQSFQDQDQKLDQSETENSITLPSTSSEVSNQTSDVDSNSKLDETIDQTLNLVSPDSYLNKDLSGMEEKLENEFKRGYEKAKEEFQEEAKKEKEGVDEKIELITNNVKSIVEGLSGLKKSILISANKNYYEIAQAVSETLLRKEISMDEKLLLSLIEQATQKIPENNITVKVSKNMYDKLMSVAEASDLKSVLKSDSSVEDGDFRIESDLNVIDGSIYNMVKDVLKDFKLNLYEEESRNTQKSEESESKSSSESEVYNKVS